MSAAPPRFNPFPGLRPFGPEERHLFFGREEQTAELLARLGRCRFLAAVGPSGSGKSSLVRAGLIPELHGGMLRGTGSHWQVAILRPGGEPLRFLAEALIQAGLFDAEDPDAPFMLRALLERSRLGLVECVRRSRLAAGTNLVIVVDQFEETFRFGRPTGSGADPAAAFVNLLLEASRQLAAPVYIVLTMRSDFLGDCARYPGLAEAVNRSEYLIPRLTREQWKLAIEGPVRVAGGQIAPRLVQRLLNDVGDDPDQLPTMQHALMRTWDRWMAQGPPGRPIDLEDYEAVGGMAEALSRHADEAFLGLTGDPQRRLAERIFRALVEKTGDSRGTRRPARVCELAAIAGVTEAEVQAVIEAFRGPGRTFLMPPGPLGSDTVVDISHESLMRIWQRMRGWAEAEAQSARMYRRLADAAQLWEEGKGGLYRDPNLEFALRWRADDQPNAAWAERLAPGFERATRFLDASREARDAELRAAEAARQRELEQERRLAEEQRLRAEQAQQLATEQRQRAEEQALAAVRMRRWAVLLALLSALAIGAGLWAWYAGTVAKSRELAAGSALQLGTDPELALLLAREAYAVRATQQAEDALRTALLASHVRERLQPAPQAPVWLTAFSPDGKTVASYEAETTGAGTLRLWEPHTGKPAVALPCGSGPLAVMAFTTNSQFLLTAGGDKVVRIWDVPGHRLQAQLTNHTGSVLSAVLSPDGKAVATASTDGTAIIWDWAGAPGNPRVLTHRDEVRDVRFSPDGQTVASACRDRAIRLWPRDPAQPARLLVNNPEAPVTEMAFSPDGRWLAGIDDDKQLRVWRAADGALLAEGTGDASKPMLTVRFSPRGDRLLTRGTQGRVSVWPLPISPLDPALDAAKVDPVRRLEPIALNHPEEVAQAEFSADGEWIITAGHDNGVRLWKAAGGTAAEIIGHQAQVNSAGFSPEGRWIASGSHDRTARLWRVPVGELLRPGTPMTELKALSGEGSRALLELAGRLGAWSFPTNLAGRSWRDVEADTTSLSWYPVSAESVRVLALDAAGNRLLARGGGGLELRDALTGLPQPELEDATFPGEFAAFSGNGARLGAYGLRQTNLLLKVWQLPEGRLAATHDWALPGLPLAIALSQDGSRVAVADSTPAIRVWDSTSPKPPLMLRDPRQVQDDAIKCLAFDPAGRWLVTGSGFGTLRLWPLDRGGEHFELSGHRASVNAVAWSHDGRFLASGSGDSTVRLWSVEGRQLLGVLRGFGENQPVVAVAFRPGDAALVAGSRDGELRVYELPELGETSELQTLAAGRSTRTLSAGEQRRFLHR